MIEVHHLNQSRSRRITWLLEELGQDYQVITYERDPKTSLAPDSLKQIHPLGKAPILRDNGEVFIESGAVLDYLVRTYGQGKFAPPIDTKAYHRYNELMHYAEGSAILPLMLGLYIGRLGDGGAPLRPRIQSETTNHLGYLNGLLGDNDYFVDNTFSAADVQLSFVIQFGVRACGPEAFPNLTRFVERIEARPAYQKAVSQYGV